MIALDFSDYSGSSYFGHAAEKIALGLEKRRLKRIIRNFQKSLITMSFADEHKLMGVIKDEADRNQRKMGR